jgi:hypothetical protein
LIRYLRPTLGGDEQVPTGDVKIVGKRERDCVAGFGGI